MFHLRDFNIGVYKTCKSSNHLLVGAFFPDLEMKQVSSVNYISYLGHV